MTKNKGVLYLIPSPIGNLNDVSPRIKDAINDCSFIACEDTRNTSKLLSLLNIQKTCISCHDHNEIQSSQNIIKSILDGNNIGYLSDAGYPCISDPGYLLAKEAIKNNIQVIPISGPSAFINALVASGIECNHFMFYGFLSSKSSERKNELESLKKFENTIIFYESPHRIKETLKDLYNVFGNRKCTVAREISKMHEEFLRYDLETFSKYDKELIGEMVIVIEGNKIKENALSEKEIISKVNQLIELGLTKKDAIISVSCLLNIPKNIIKKLFL